MISNDELDDRLADYLIRLKAVKEQAAHRRLRPEAERAVDWAGEKRVLDGLDRELKAIHAGMANVKKIIERRRVRQNNAKGLVAA